MPWQVQGRAGSGSNILDVDAFGSGRALLYDANGNVLVPADKSVAPATQGYLPVSGLDSGTVLRAIRVGTYSSQRTTSEQILWQDAFEGANINAFWTQSLATMTAVQVTGVLTLNNGGITTLNTDAIITSQRQFPKYARQPLYCRFRALLSANPAANHTIAELGFGAPTTTTAIVQNGAFFRWRADGTLAAVLSYNGTEQVTQVLAQGVVATTSYYYYDVIVDDDFARFIVSDSSERPIVDMQMPLSLSIPYSFAVSHVPSFARVYVDGVGGGTAVQLKLSAHTVQILDALNNMPWSDQSALAMRSALVNPLTGAQTPSPFNAIPATLTPANATTGYAFLGGEYAVAGVAAIETGAPIFTFQNPTPYSLVLQSIQIPAPMVTTAMSLTGVPFIEWFVCVNATTNLLSTGGGLRQALGIQYTTTIAPAIGTLWSATGATTWAPKTPLICLPGLFTHIGFKWLVTTAAATPGINRGTVSVDGYWM